MWGLIRGNVESWGRDVPMDLRGGYSSGYRVIPRHSRPAVRRGPGRGCRLECRAGRDGRLGPDRGRSERGGRWRRDPDRAGAV